MSSPRQANDLVNGVGVSGGGGCNKLIGEHSFSVRGPAKSHPRPLAKDDKQAFGPAKFPQPGRHRHILPATLPADPMDATIIDERLADFDLALVFCRVVVLDPFRVVPDVLLVNANSAKS